MENEANSEGLHWDDIHSPVNDEDRSGVSKKIDDNDYDAIMEKAKMFLDERYLDMVGTPSLKEEDDDDDYDEIEEIQVELEKIPSDTPKVKLMEKLSLVFIMLCDVDRITAETFILYNIKDHFKLTKEDAKKYIPHLNNLRKELNGPKKEKKGEEHLPLIFDRDIDSKEAHDAISELGIVNEETFKIITAVIISAQLRPNPPLWLFLIGVPSSLKTELVGFYEAMDEVYTLDTLSENAFSSGYVPPDGSEPKDLLPFLDNKSFIIKDLNTLFSMNEEMVKKILGDLTSIFDGKFEKFTATRGLVRYNSLFSMVGCVTPSILIKHYNYVTQLGPRFLFLRLPQLTKENEEIFLKKFWSETDRKNKIIKTRQLVSSYCAQLIKKIKQHKNDPETKEIQNTINSIALFICKARGVAITSKSTFKNEKGKDVDYYEITDWQVEEPWRILNQLKSLLRVLSFINGKNIVSEEEINIIKPIVLSTMPVDRAEILNTLVLKCGLSAGEIGKNIEKSTKTIRRTLKELEALKIIDCFRDPKDVSGVAPWLYYIVPEFSSVLGAPIPSPEFMSQSRSVLDKRDPEKEVDSLINDLNSIPPKDEDGIDDPSDTPF